MSDIAKLFTPDPKNERPQDAMDDWQRANYARIHADTRAALENLLCQTAPVWLLLRWQDQNKRGVKIGSDDLHFHFGIGMTVRNLLRNVLTDDALPAVQIGPDGGKDYQEPTRNWDDHYFGALYAVCR